MRKRLHSSFAGCRSKTVFSRRQKAKKKQKKIVLKNTKYFGSENRGRQKKLAFTKHNILFRFEVVDVKRFLFLPVFFFFFKTVFLPARLYLPANNKF